MRPRVFVYHLNNGAHGIAVKKTFISYILKSE
jgi:hypothetical protein